MSQSLSYMSLIDTLQLRLSEGLLRRSSVTCSSWAQNYIVLGKPIPGKLGFKYHPWSREWMDHNGDWTGMKAAQMAMTMAALSRGLFTIDIRRNDVLYVLPKRNPDATDFSKAKFDTLLELSPHLEAMFSNVKNVGHKQAGNVNFFLRGSRSKSALKSISVGLKVYDEFDEMNQKNVSLADERSSGYQETDKQTIKLSTPTVPEYGIAREILNTTQEHYFFICPRCGRRSEFVFPDDIVVTADSLQDDKNLRRSYVRCHECKRPLEQEAKFDFLGKAKWESTANHDASVRGFMINQLYSMTVQPWEIAKSFLKAQVDPAEEQELYNSKGGLAHAVAGARLTDEIVNACRGSHRKTEPPKAGLITMGVDVGHKQLFVWIDRWALPPSFGSDLNTYAQAQTLYEGTVSAFRDLDRYMRQYQVNHAVVDVDPAFREAEEFAERFDGRVNLARFVRGLKKSKIRTRTDESDKVIHANRTYWLDVSQNRFRGGPKRILLPADIDDDAVRHLKALIRLDTKDDEGNPISKYISVGPDHKAFARVYSEMALPLAASIASGQDIQNLL